MTRLRPRPPTRPCGLTPQVLDLSSNNFNGTLPPLMYSHLPGLTHLNLTNNQLVGEIPMDWADWTSLLVLRLGRNDLTSAPGASALMGQLEMLDLSYNSLAGPLPSPFTSIGYAPIQHILLCGNRFTGQLPLHWAGLTDLVTIEVCENYLSGPLPPAWIANLTSLEILNISGNGLDGQLLPTSLTEWRALRILDISRQGCP